MKKKGFISMAVIYSFIIVFVLLIVSLLSLYAFRNNVANGLINEVKEELNKGYE